MRLFEPLQTPLLAQGLIDDLFKVVVPWFPAELADPGFGLGHKLRQGRLGDGGSAAPLKRHRITFLTTSTTSRTNAPWP